MHRRSGLLPWLGILLVVLAALTQAIPAFGAVPAVVAGDSHTAVLKSDGTVWAWGNDTNGQLGDGGSGVRATPSPVVGLVGVVAIAAGRNHTLALRSDGTVWAWGKNDQGQLGDGTTTDRNSPVQVQGLSNATGVAAGGDHSFALRSDGTAMSWGRNDYGQLGDGTLANQLFPVRVTAISGVTAFAAGNGYSVAIKSDGSVWAWGHNDRGQLGDGTNVDRLFPVHIDPFGVLGVVNVVAVAAGASSTYALKADGSVWVWGDDTNAQLGVSPSGGASFSATPLLLSGLAGVTHIAAGASYAVATKSDGSVWAWGSNGNGQAGTGTPGSPLWVYAPMQVSGVAAVAIAAGGGQTVAIKSDNTMLAWGFNAYGQLGIGTLADTASPTAVVGGRGAGTLNVASGPSPRTGWWWNPAEAGRGFMIELRGGNLFFGAFLYDSGGGATWLVATGPVASSSVFQGDLLAFGGGQTLTGSYHTNTALASPGRVTLQFIDSSHGTLTWPGGTIPIQRFNIVPNGLSAPPAAFQPESGWWWNPAEPGRGFGLEIQNGTLFMVGFMYDANGNAVWYVSRNPMTSQTFYQGSWAQFGSGQTLTGPYHAPSVQDADVGTLALRFVDEADAVITLPGGAQVSLTRFGP